MAKSKNHTNHNQNRKAHKNGIKKPKVHKFMSRKGLDPKFFKNQKYCLKGIIKKKKELKLKEKQNKKN
ncbi:60S ribosomal protein L29, putative [Plasmodium ovale wallikeri]|uniref:60S ribosomal protein L29 n=3 Tax=Plasmodium ovale TaxID=36330 RepID=A0A1A8W5R9_PLAOA|nr:60S ribosomal protein L29, putative [Plasmodium ovale curtisi]SBT42446.1 60S ribosomal protein L29, putative [Plasmodium ovale wallikeri]SBT78331.1 60S ribosomal protein L29, putative [Plasmodium ovale]SBS96916.1 60S ribosomal protein L29, putative [Plasmodium ovale curtisi]SBT42724.1 60S ribosomal protein L29, putative [Plasmodium ovale wallikeri]